ncbi:hypothetical protein TNCV_2592711 [Trichonephila clavipes]|nr:hypothetical protein TNCV_2592711 [Trichonephila clavipes]
MVEYWVANIKTLRSSALQFSTFPTLTLSNCRLDHPYVNRYPYWCNIYLHNRKAWQTGHRASTTMGTSSCSRFIMIRIISMVGFRLYSPKNCEFRIICRLATCDGRRPSVRPRPTTIDHHYSFS